ncbi:glycosyltransferase family 4 protein [Fusicatenibacter saccharivorans]|uniref:glycosyltransferase family 4 protein n=1 Tax=Fusicatenibacter saccharivorans TaxID=1150298 RepID=UPI003D03902D
MGGVMPVPAVCGGAIETLVTSIAKKYSTQDGFQLTICSVYHPKAVEISKQYPEVRFFWTHTRNIKYMFMHAIFLGVRMITGKCIRPLQRHYNEIAELFRKEKFDLIIAEGGDTQAIIDIAKGYTRDQFANHIHIHYLPPENIVQNYGNVIGVSEFVTKEYLKVCKMPVKPHVLKNAIDVQKFSRNVSDEQKRSIRKKLGLKEDDFVVLYVGRIMEIKGVLELMQAVTGLEDKHIKLLIMGSANSGKWAYSSYERRVKKLSEQNKDRIIFTGYVDNSEVYQYAAVADVQCLPTLIAEAAPLVVLEAMAEGLPMIVTKSGGVIEYVDDSTALMIEQENIIDNLKEAICYLKKHPEARRQMSKNAKIQSKRYNEAIYYKNFIDLINKIMFENMENKNGN